MKEQQQRNQFYMLLTHLVLLLNASSAFIALNPSNACIHRHSSRYNYASFIHHGRLCSYNNMVRNDVVSRSSSSSSTSKKDSLVTRKNQKKNNGFHVNNKKSNQRVAVKRKKQRQQQQVVQQHRIMDEKLSGEEAEELLWQYIPNNSPKNGIRCFRL